MRDAYIRFLHISESNEPPKQLVVCASVRQTKFKVNQVERIVCHETHLFTFELLCMCVHRFTP